ncbi:MAG TPA: TonB-dependent receptor [Ignavibacteriaceae bacterium]|nr:TonB-dependent receptor [Ignavibacteriaceae bacterium]
MKLFNSLIILILYSSTILAQIENGTVYGRVTDAVSGQPLPGVNIILMGTDFGAATDIDGKYEIKNVPVNTYQIKASYIGYSPWTKADIVVRPSKPAEVDFNLVEEAIRLQDVTVTSGFFSKAPTDIISTSSFGYEEIRRTPGGFEDVVRALSVLPGVAQAEAGRNDLIVRGGAPSENLYILDGIEIPNINHFGTQGAAGGPLSYINLDYVKESTFSTGGFSSEYGDKLSSVLKINLRDGRDDRLGGKATISASQFGLNLEGPLGKNNNFIFSVRRSYLDFIFKAAGFGFVPEYYDLISKADFKLDKNNSISFLFVGAFDNVKYFNDTEDQRFDNSRILGSDQKQYVTGIIYQHLITNGFLNLTLSRTFIDYNTSQRDFFLNPIFEDISREQENSLKADIVYKVSSSTELSAGVTGKYIKFNADVLFPHFVTSFGDTLPISTLNTKQIYSKAAAYINLNKIFYERLKTNLGLRLDFFNPLEKKLYFAPRISASYNLTDLTSINLSGGIYYQSPSYIWLAVEDNKKNLTDIRAEQLILGVDHLIREDALIKIEAFYKWYSNYPASLIRPYLILANTGAGYAGTDDNFSAFGLEPLINKGRGISRGVEFSVQKKLSDMKMYGILSLTYSETRFTSLDGITRRGLYDQNWIISLSSGYKFDENWEASLKFRFSSGSPYTPFEPDGKQLVSKYLTETYQPLHSLDLRVDRRWYFSNLTLITYVDIQNIYNNKRSNSIRWNSRTKIAEKGESIGILPSLGISLEF